VISFSAFLWTDGLRAEAGFFDFATAVLPSRLTVQKGLDCSQVSLGEVLLQLGAAARIERLLTDTDGERPKHIEVSKLVANLS
jgi:hypothetical protein